MTTDEYATLSQAQIDALLRSHVKRKAEAQQKIMDASAAIESAQRSIATSNAKIEALLEQRPKAAA